jgi:hypothetical protein
MVPTDDKTLSVVVILRQLAIMTHINLLQVSPAHLFLHVHQFFIKGQRFLWQGRSSVHYFLAINRIWLMGGKKITTFFKGKYKICLRALFT